MLCLVRIVFGREFVGDCDFFDEGGFVVVVFFDEECDVGIEVDVFVQNLGDYGDVCGLVDFGCWGIIVWMD